MEAGNLSAVLLIFFQCYFQIYFVSFLILDLIPISVRMLFYDYDCKLDRDIGQNVHEYLKIQFVQLFTYYFNKHFKNLFLQI